MQLIDLLNRIINNYHYQYALYEQMLDLSIQSKDLLREGQWAGQIDSLRRILNERMQLAVQMEEYNVVNRRLQNKVIRILNLEEFSLSKIEGNIPSELYTALKDQIDLIAGKLSLISHTDLESEICLKGFIAERLNQPGKNTSRQAAELYRQIMQQGEIVKKA